MSYYAHTDYDPYTEEVDEAELALEADRFAYLASFDEDPPAETEFAVSAPFPVQQTGLLVEQPDGSFVLTTRVVCGNRLGEVA